MKIEELILFYENKLEFLDKQRDEASKCDNDLKYQFCNGGHIQVSAFIKDLKNLKPNELRAVNRNETAKEDLRFEDGHVCKYCGALTRQPDEVCYMNPNRKSD